jgi:hypothetical protein
MSEDGDGRTQAVEERPSELPRESLVSPSAPRPPSSAALAAATAVLSAVVFAVSAGGSWIWDDHTLIENNGWIKSFTHWRHWFSTHLWDVNAQFERLGVRIRYWRPIITFSYAVDWAIGGGSPVYFHATNLLWQALVGFLTFRALERWLVQRTWAFVGALLFAVHPTKAESVAWIAGRTDVICLAAMLLCAEAVAYRLRARTSRARAAAIGLEVLATALAYASKEQSIVLPAFVAIEAWAAAGRRPIERGVVVRCLRAAAPQLVVAIAYVLVRRVVLPMRDAYGEFSPGMRVEMVLESFGRYAAATFWPLDLSVQKALLRADASGRLIFHRGYEALGAATIAGTLALAWLARRRLPAVTVGLVFYLASLLPTANVVPSGMITLVSDRFLYVPLLGLALALMSVLELVPPARRRAALLGLGLLTALAGAGALARSADFLDEKGFWAREAKLHPESLDARRFEIAEHMRARRFHAALRATAGAQRVAAERFGFTHWEGAFVSEGVRLLAILTPDRDEARLRTIARFCEAANDRNLEAAVLELPDAHVTLKRAALAWEPPNDQPRVELLALRADILSRLGDDQAAQKLSAEVHGRCPVCRDLGRVRALIAARAGLYADAFAVLDQLRQADIAATNVDEDYELLRRAAILSKQASVAPEGPLQLNLRATELSTLDAWGRAYGLLAPHKELIKHAPGMAYGFAELAFRAGYGEVSREMLGVLVPPEKIGPTEQRWARKMGWIDVGPDDEPPAQP